MRRGLVLGVLGVLMISLVFGLDADDLNLSYEGNMSLEGLNLSDLNLSEEELMQIYNENKDNISEDDLDVLVEGALDSEIGRYMGNASCNFAKEAFEQGAINVEIPDQVPFKTDIFTIFVDDKFMISAEIEDRNLTGIYCEVPENTNYNIYISSSLLVEIVSKKGDVNPVDFYNEKRKSGELLIKPVGIKRKFKMFFLNLGMKIAGAFV